MRILLVEDEHLLANSIKQGLEQESYAVDIVFDGKDGFEMATMNDYDIMIFDIMLPTMDGLTIIRELRKLKNHTPILLLTAKGQIEDKVKGLNSGADDYLVKPFAFEELTARLRALSRRPKTAQDTILEVEDLSLNTATYEVKRAQHTIQLSQKEFSILEYLMRHPNQILTKGQIADHVWNYDEVVMPNTIEVYIKNLRRKVDDKGRPLIQTIKGFGYKIGGTS